MTATETVVGRLVPDANAPALLADLGDGRPLAVRHILLGDASEEVIREALRQARLTGVEVVDSGVTADLEDIRALLDMFQCLRCGNCCYGQVFNDPLLPLSKLDAQAIVQCLWGEREEFRKLCIKRNGVLYLKLPCPFLEENRCMIYQVRPSACLLFPIHGPMTVNISDEVQPPTLAVNINCPAGIELVVQAHRLGKGPSDSG